MSENRRPQEGDFFDSHTHTIAYSSRSDAYTLSMASSRTLEFYKAFEARLADWLKLEF